ncbi:S-formylglutathione hydrolase FrmB [Hungatella effluvii]|uniref:S-formylglutathione hydrolase FrmB n=1 Tax=Hungatella effluvii TaxID=1096246 RepID=A0A2V3XVF3_9FIRM|nr:alpha/beta hydrolase family protein [Hungatella effluvii]PXX46382.1 S-formylglutathione hydrolase FrmB [Hungatella effluvii]
MALIQMSMFSESLQVNTDVNIMIPTPNPIDPEESDQAYFQEGVEYPVLYLLHGTHGDRGDWHRYTSIERYAQKAKIITVCPSGNNSFYQDMVIGGRYFKFLTEELPTYMRIMFPVSKKRENTFIGGLSMGGYGAMNLGIRRPDLYGSVICLSAGMGSYAMVGTNKYKHNPYDITPWPFEAILPPPFDGTGSPLDDLPILTKHMETGTKLPRIYLAIGTEDFIYEAAQKTRKSMDDLGVNYTYEEGPGCHDWIFWDSYIQRAINWLQER